MTNRYQSGGKQKDRGQTGDKLMKTKWKTDGKYTANR